MRGSEWVVVARCPAQTVQLPTIGRIAYCDGELDEVLEFIDRHEDAIEELDRLFVPLVDEMVMLLRLNVGVTGSDEELVPLFTAIGFFSRTLLHLLGLCWIALISPVIGLRLIAVLPSCL